MTKKTKLLLIVSISMLITAIKLNAQTNKPQTPQPQDKPISVTLPASQWVFIYNYIQKTQQLLQATSSAPANAISAHNDTLGLVNQFFAIQINKSLADTTGKKK